MGGQWAGLLGYRPWLPCPLPSAFSINLVQVLRIGLRAAGLVGPARAAPLDGAVDSGTDGPAPLSASRVVGAVTSVSGGSGKAPGTSNEVAGTGIVWPILPAEIAVLVKEGTTAAEGVEVPGEHSRRRLLGAAAAPPAPPVPSLCKTSIHGGRTVICDLPSARMASTDDPQRWQQPQTTNLRTPRAGPATVGHPGQKMNHYIFEPTDSRPTTGTVTVFHGHGDPVILFRIV